ncbi:hypothetical protein IFM89_032501 [Coptis chinensis]|uniref:F-box domain-containing protein n=1 Tax=Coptis chinensis TaxID=261450 RepID=A0A835ITY0_9MAGN|nr:hypothetical protein IFM89_032501 [Coptis chinensis]
MSGLIEGLPDAVALRCLARVPLYLHPNLQLVCRSWRGALHSREFFRSRREVGASEDLLCVCAFEPENLWQLYDPRRDLWMTVPVLPSDIRHLANFGVVSTAGKLFVLGGGSDAVDPLTGDHYGIFASNEVWSYDPLLRQWARRASMLVHRAMFACCVLDGKIVVAGGFTTCRKSISKAEAYDLEKDVWIAIPDLPHTHNSACSGVLINGKVHVLHKGLSTVQNREQRKRKILASASDFKSRIGFAMIGLGDNLYVIGGVIGPGRWNLDIKPLSDVDVLTVGSERPTWRMVTPMTECHGSVLGCTMLRI